MQAARRSARDRVGGDIVHAYNCTSVNSATARLCQNHLHEWIRIERCVSWFRNPVGDRLTTAHTFLMKRRLLVGSLLLGVLSCATSSMAGVTTASVTPVIEVRPESAQYTATVTDGAIALSIRVTVQNRAGQQIELASCGTSAPWFTLERLSETGWIRGYEGVCAGASSTRIRVEPRGSLTFSVLLLHSWSPRAIPMFTAGRVDATYRVRLGMSWVPSSSARSAAMVPDSIVRSQPFEIRLLP